MATIRVRNLGPFSKDVRPGGNFGDLLAEVEVGGEIDVVEALAGREPGEWELSTERADDGRDYRLVMDEARANGALAELHWEARDHGAGLLAQVDGWARVTPAKSKATDEKKEG